MSLEPQGGYGNGALLPGPAGYITVPGTSGVVVVDAVNPHRILESLPAETQHDATLTAVAVAEAHVQRTHIIAPLAALETVLAANASEEYDALVDDRIWRTLPAAVAVARAAADAPGIVDNLSLRHREQLRDRVRALQAGLRRRHWTGAGTSDLEGLALLLTEPPDVPATEVSADVGLRVAGVDSGAAGFALDLSTDDLRLDLGELADLMFAGATFAGVIPGLVEVRAVLQVNASGQLPTLVAQIAMPNGEIVAEAPVRVLTDRRVLPLATAELQVPAIAGERSTDLHGTVVAARPSPRTADSWRRLALRRGRSAGVQALRARDAGQPARERVAWQRSAAFHRFAGLPDVAAHADSLAEGVGADAAATWMYALLNNWSAAVAELLASGAEEREPLSRTVRDLTLAAPGEPALVDARLAVARLLLSSDVDADHEDGIESAAAALRLSYRIGDEARATAAARLLADA